MKRATTIANVARLEALRMLIHAQDRHVCACGLIRLDYLPERRVGSITHGILTCYRESQGG